MHSADHQVVKGQLERKKKIPGGKGRHSPIAADDQGRAIAALLKAPEGHIGTAIDLSGPVEMDYEQMAAELSEALGRKIVYQDGSIAPDALDSARHLLQLL